ncbi:class I SAM-dependent methyltransferase [Candidatus Woesearchaeota archaeon]|nr:class I SAM-dependent methyltransferase [Candidatus Woesearchaeota archaeon]
MKKWTLEMANKWKNYKPPIRPSKWDIAVFSKYLDKKIREKGRDVKVLILGSTPELRDLVNSKKLTAYVCDYSKDNNEALKLLKKVKGKEILIRQDWTKLKLKQKFDLVFAEASLTVVKKQQVIKILKNVKKLLKDDGLFISKTWVRLPKKGLSLKKMMSIYRRKYKGKSFRNYMNQMLHSLYYDADKGSLQKQYYTFKKLYNDGKITKKEFISIEGLGYETSPLVLFLPLHTEFLKMAKKYFKVKVEMPKQIGENKIPIHVMKK